MNPVSVSADSRRGWLPLCRRAFGLLFNGLNLLASLDQRRRSVEEQRRQQHADLLQQRTAQLYAANPSPSYKLGDAAFGSVADAQRAGLLNRGKGIPLGFLEHHALSYLADGHILVSAPTGAGKFTRVIAPFLAMNRDESVFIVDARAGETPYSTLEHRAKVLGQPVLFLNPNGTLGLPSARINTLAGLIRRVLDRDSVLEAARRIALLLIPIEAGLKEPWAKEGAQELLIVAMIFLAHQHPERCNFGGVYDFLIRDDAELIKDLRKVVAKSDAPGGIQQLALTQARLIERGPGQWLGYLGALKSALLFAAPGEAYREALSTTDFDITSLKRTPTTLYLMIEGERLETGATYLQLVIDYAMDAIASADGPVRTNLMLDELQQIAPLSRLEKSLALYRERRVRCWLFLQDYPRLTKQYGPYFAPAVEQACAVWLAWNLEDLEVIGRIERLAGTTTVAVTALNTGASTVGSAGWAVQEHARPLLQSHQIRAIGNGKALLRITGQPNLWVVDLPHYFEIAECTSLRDPRTVPHRQEPPLSAGSTL